jgi:hypothetical protein
MTSTSKPRWQRYVVRQPLSKTTGFASRLTVLLVCLFVCLFVCILFFARLFVCSFVCMLVCMLVSLRVVIALWLDGTLVVSPTRVVVFILKDAACNVALLCFAVRTVRA